MTSSLDSRTASRGDRDQAVAYLKDFVPGIAGYLVAVGVVVPVLVSADDTGWVSLWALLPLLPALWIVRAVVRHYGRVDELQRLLLLQGAAIGFGVAMLAAMTLGFLAAGGVPMLVAGWVVLAAGLVGWGLGTGVLGLRRG